MRELFIFYQSPSDSVFIDINYRFTDFEVVTHLLWLPTTVQFKLLATKDLIADLVIPSYDFTSVDVDVKVNIVASTDPKPAGHITFMLSSIREINVAHIAAMSLNS